MGASAWPEEPAAPWRPAAGDWVEFHGCRGQVVYVDWTPRGFEHPGRWIARVNLDNGKGLTAPVELLGPAKPPRRKGRR